MRQWIRLLSLSLLLVILGGRDLGAQNPVSIAQVGTTPVTTTVPVSGTVTANQGTSPWVISFTSAQTVNQGTSPWVISFTSPQAVTVADGSDVTLGAKADAKSTATDTTAITLMQVFKEISFMEQNPASRAVTNAGTFAVQVSSALPAGTNVIGHVIADSGSTTAVTGNVTVVQPTGTNLHAVLDTTSTTAVTQATAASLNATVVGTGTFAAQATLQTQTDTVMVGGVNIKEINAVTPLMGNGATGTGALRVSIANDSTGVVQPGNTANTTPWLVQSVPGTTNGLTFYVVEPAASDNHVVIKNGAGTVYHISAFNNSATVNYLRLYNAGTGFNGCNSASNLQWEANIPASTSGTGFVQDISQGIAFATGISICVTGAYGQTTTTNATASAISINIGYK